MQSHCSGHTRDRYYWVYMIILLRRWSWKEHLSVTPGKTSFGHLIVQVSSETQLIESVCYFTRRVVLKRPFISDTLEETLHIHCLGLPGHRTLQGDMIVLLRRWSWNGRLFSHDIIDRHKAQYPRDLPWESSLTGVVVNEGLISDNAYFGREWWSWKDWRQSSFELIQ